MCDGFFAWLRCDGGFHPWFWGVIGHLTGGFRPWFRCVRWCFAWLRCDGVGVSMVSTFGGGWDFCSNRYQCFHEECDVILLLVG